MRVLASVDLTAIERNVALLAAKASSARLCAVVKGNAYGHGDREVAAAAARGGAEWLAVSTAVEAQSLRSAGLELPILVMGALTDDELELALAANADVVAWTDYFISRLAALGGGRAHIKLDTGMGRLGTRNPALATQLVERAAADPQIDLVGLMTHFATADELNDQFFGEQLARFTAWADVASEKSPGLIRHAANSAALLRDPASHFDLVRPGVACYGLDPFGLDPTDRELVPAMRLESYVACVERSEPGDSNGYGRSFIAAEPTSIGTIPIGYADGWPRAFSNSVEVLIGGKRFPVVGNISMDNMTVDLGGDGGGVEVGAKATLIGDDGADRVLAEELARGGSTINYEIVASISDRVPRKYSDQTEGPR